MKKEEQNKLLMDRISMLKSMMNESFCSSEKRDYAEKIKETEDLL